MKFALVAANYCLYYAVDKEIEADDVVRIDTPIKQLVTNSSQYAPATVRILCCGRAWQ